MHCKWQEAYLQNERKRMADSAESVISRMQAGKSSNVKTKTSSPGELEKDKGNEAFKRGDYVEV